MKVPVEMRKIMERKNQPISGTFVDVVGMSSETCQVNGAAV